MIEVKSLESAPLEILTDDEVEAMISEWDELEAKDREIALLKTRLKEMAIKRDIYVGSFAPGYRRR